MTPLAMMSHAMISTTLHELIIGVARATMPQKMSNNASGIDGLDVFLAFSTILPLCSTAESNSLRLVARFPNPLAARSADILRAVRRCHPRHRSVHPPDAVSATRRSRQVASPEHHEPYRVAMDHLRDLRWLHGVHRVA